MPSGVNRWIVGSAPERIITIRSSVSPVPWIVRGETEGKCRVIIIEAIPIPGSKILVIVGIPGVCLFVVITGCIDLGRCILLLILISCCSELRVATRAQEKQARENTREKNLLQASFHDVTLTSVKRLVNRFIYYNIGASQSVPDTHQNPLFLGVVLTARQHACAYYCTRPVVAFTIHNTRKSSRTRSLRSCLQP